MGGLTVYRLTVYRLTMGGSLQYTGSLWGVAYSIQAHYVLWAVLTAVL